MRGYTAFLTAAMRFRWITIGATVAAFALALLAIRFVPQQFFPASDRTELLVDLTLPQNASIFASETAVKRLDAALAKDPDVAFVCGMIGHHVGAISMSEVELKYGDDEKAKTMAKNIIDEFPDDVSVARMPGCSRCSRAPTWKAEAPTASPPSWSRRRARVSRAVSTRRRWVSRARMSATSFSRIAVSAPRRYP